MFLTVLVKQVNSVFLNGGETSHLRDQSRTAGYGSVILLMTDVFHTSEPIVLHLR